MNIRCHTVASQDAPRNKLRFPNLALLLCRVTVYGVIKPGGATLVPSNSSALILAVLEGLLLEALSLSDKTAIAIPRPTRPKFLTRTATCCSGRVRLQRQRDFNKTLEQERELGENIPSSSRLNSTSVGIMAERVGFEPTVEFPPLRFSRPVH